MLSNFITSNMDSLLLGVIILSIFILIVFISVNVKLSKVSKKYKELTQGVDGLNLEDLLLHQTKCIKDAQGQINELKQRIIEFEQKSRLVISKVYSKRYNAFPEMGSDLSFSAVLLNDKNTGIMITSIYGRDENRVYLKPIIEGECKYPYSPEEREIVFKAFQSNF